jgi:hypothetical protein
MKGLMIVGLLAAIGITAVAGQANAASRYCLNHPSDPDCYDQLYGNGPDYNGDYPRDPNRDYPRDPNFDGPGYDQGYGDQWNGRGVGDSQFKHPRPPYGDYRPVSRCERIGFELRRRGYRYVRPIDCSGSNFKYEAFRYGQSYTIKVKSNGRIIYEIAN